MQYGMQQERDDLMSCDEMFKSAVLCCASADIGLPSGRDGIWAILGGLGWSERVR